MARILAPDDYLNEVLVLVVRYACLCFFMHGASSLLSAAFVDYYRAEETVKNKRFLHGVRERAWATWCKRVTWDYTICSAVYCSGIFYFYVMGMMEFKGDLNARWTGISAATKHGISFHVASAMYETICYALSGKEFVFYLHHVVTIGCCSSMLLTGRAHFWCCVLGLVEGSNVPLCFLHVFGRIPVLKASILYVANGALLWIAYVILRLPIPAAMFLLGKDLYYNTKAQGGPAWVVEDETFQRAWVIFLFLSGSFLWLLSMVWFQKITNGLLSAISGKKSNKEKTS